MKSRVVGSLAFLLVVFVAAQARAQTAKADETSPADSEKYVRVLQQKPFVKGVRFELEPTFNIPLNESLSRHLGAGVQLRVHIDDQWAIGLDYIKWFGVEYPHGVPDHKKDIGENYQVYPEERPMDFYVGGHLTYSPIQGKLLWFGSLGRPVFWDMYLIAGGGAQKTLWGNWHGSGNFGLGVRFQWLEWLASNLEVRDYMFMENYAHDDKFMNNVVFTAGIAVFVPPSHRYKYPK